MAHLFYNFLNLLDEYNLFLVKSNIRFRVICSIKFLSCYRLFRIIVQSISSTYRLINSSNFLLDQFPRLIALLAPPTFSLTSFANLLLE